jgi:hypothetical protein
MKASALPVNPGRAARVVKMEAPVFRSADPGDGVAAVRSEVRRRTARTPA